MTETHDTGPVSFGEFSILSDNYHQDSKNVNAAARLESLVAQNPFPLYPDTFSIVICRSGNISLTSGGVRLSAGPRTAMVSLGGQPIDAVEISPDCRFLYFAGKSNYFNTQIDLDDANRILRLALEIKHPFLFPLTPSEFRAMEKLYFSAKELLLMAPEPSKAGIVAGYARILSTLIVAKLQSHGRQTEEEAQMTNRSMLMPFLENVKRNCRYERKIAFYSGLANLTPKYFSKQIKLLSGKSPGAIINEYTLTEAKTLLSSKKYSIKEVSNLMNFSSPSSFCKFFKSGEGMSPGKYMEQF